MSRIWDKFFTVVAFGKFCEPPSCTLGAHAATHMTAINTFDARLGLRH